MKTICLGVWNQERKPRRLTNHVAAHPQAYASLRKAWRVHAASAVEARHLIDRFEKGFDVGEGPFGRPRVEVVKDDRTSDTGSVRIPKRVFDGIEAVRRSGLTNMLDRPVVAEVAEGFGFERAARWIETHRKEYAEGIFRGFQPKGEN